MQSPEFEYLGKNSILPVIPALCSEQAEYFVTTGLHCSTGANKRHGLSLSHREKSMNGGRFTPAWGGFLITEKKRQHRIHRNISVNHLIDPVIDQICQCASTTRIWDKALCKADNTLTSMCLNTFNVWPILEILMVVLIYQNSMLTTHNVPHAAREENN